MAGVHCCGGGDWAAILAAGPAVLSLPADAGCRRVSPAIWRAFLDGGGWIAWGAVPTDRPVGGSPDRYWRELAGALVRAGAGRLRPDPAAPARPS